MEAVLAGEDTDGLPLREFLQTDAARHVQHGLVHFGGAVVRDLLADGVQLLLLSCFRLSFSTQHVESATKEHQAGEREQNYGPCQNQPSVGSHLGHLAVGAVLGVREALLSDEALQAGPVAVKPDQYGGDDAS
eukprot:scaffold94_cov254-Pinguiococcus_pyrenoidosus.AAC.13